VAAAAAFAAALLGLPSASAGGTPTISLGADGETSAAFSYTSAIRERVFIPIAGVDQDGDGADDRIAIDVTRPAETEQGLKVPAIVYASPYLTSLGISSEVQYLHTSASGAADRFPNWYDNYFVPRGYAVVLAEANGTGFSTGCPLHGGPGDVASMKAVIDWLEGRVPGYDASNNAVSASWDSGKNAMIGKSYDGTLANGVAATGVQGLTTIVPISAISNWYDYSRSNGIRFNTNYPTSLSTSIVTNQNASVLGVVPPDRLNACASTRATLSAEDGDETGDVNDFWAARNYVTNVGSVHASVLMSFGLNDDNVKTDQLLPWWQGLAANNTPRKLWLSEDGHVDPFQYRRTVWIDTLHRWFDYWLQGVPNGIMSEPKVSIERAPGVWEDDSDWPLAGTSEVGGYLQASAAGAPGVIAESSGGPQPTLTFTDAATQSETTMIRSPTGSQANRLVFLTPPLEQNVHISGAPLLDLHASFNKADGYLGAILVDYSDSPFATPAFGSEGVRATTTIDCGWAFSTTLDTDCYHQETEGTTNAVSWRVSKGILDAQNRNSLTAPTPLVAGTAYDFQLPLLPNDYVFQAGHRVGIVVVSNYRNYDEVTDTSAPTAIVTVDARQSKIELPIVGGTAAAEAAGMFGEANPPTVHLPSTVTVEATGPSTPVTYGAATATDDTDPSPTVACTPASGSGFAVGTTAVQCTATDRSGNTATQSFNITVRDTTAPTLHLPDPVIAEATGSNGAAVTYDATATDLVDGAPTVSCSPASGSTFALGATTVDCTSTDASGNHAHGSFTVTVADRSAPTFSLPSTTTVEAVSATGANVSYTATAADTVDAAPTVSCTPASGTRFGLGATTVHCTATDAAGNHASGTFDVIVSDTTAPTLHLPAHVAAEASAPTTSVSYAATATDTVDPSPTVSCSPAAGTGFGLGTTTVHCSARDANGNTTTGSFDVAVVDTTAPVLHLAPVTAEATDAHGAAVDYAATATDLADGSPTVSCLPASGSTFPVGVTTVDCTAADAAGNHATSSFAVTVTDTIAPTLSLPDDKTIEADSATGATVTYTATAADAADAAPTVSCTPASGTRFAVGVTTVRCTATDAAGNARHGTFRVTVGDTTAPVLELPSRIDAEAESAAGTRVTFTATATDTADASPSVSCSPSSGSIFTLGPSIVHCTAKDSSGNTTHGTFLVAIADRAAPTIHAPAPVSVEATSGAGARVDYAASAADAVDSAPTFACAPASGSTFSLGITTVHCSATDRSGNAASASFDVTVRDTTAPTLHVPHTVNADSGADRGVVVHYVVTAIDDVDPSSEVDCTPASGARFGLGRTTVHCTATDASGNTAHASFVVEVDGAASTVDAIGHLLPKSKQGKRLGQELTKISRLVSASRSKAACQMLAAFTAELRRPGLSAAARTALAAEVKRLSRSLRC
jgi:X-Pro dipeptidyl-peptidase